MGYDAFGGREGACFYAPVLQKPKYAPEVCVNCKPKKPGIGAQSMHELLMAALKRDKRDR